MKFKKGSEKEREQKNKDEEKPKFKCLRCNREYQSKSCYTKHKRNVCYNIELPCPKCPEKINVCDGIDKLMDHFYICECGGEFLKRYPNEPLLIKEKMNENVKYNAKYNTNKEFNYIRKKHNEKFSKSEGNEDSQRLGLKTYNKSNILIDEYFNNNNKKYDIKKGVNKEEINKDKQNNHNNKHVDKMTDKNDISVYSLICINLKKKFNNLSHKMVILRLTR